ncbi:type II secretion system F family protein [Chthonobacter rhizosphaerae]|uniref:type II secretion system F family protein n=1 Tax=Chthonobacter rhizosphaerae TaxID=2735553 RepID=UPI0015EE56EE|nr:type II secretion system F family protein [Chthonobacter rhizosphaerae]
MMTTVLQVAIPVLGALAVALLVLGVPLRWPAPLLRLTARDTELAGEAAEVFGWNEVSPTAMILAYVGSAAVIVLLAWLATGSVMLGLVASPLGALLPKMIIRYLLKRRWKQIEAQLPYSVDQIVSAVRSGKPLGTAIGMVADTGVAPASREFERIAREQKLGMGLVDALDRHGRSVTSLHFKMVDAALGLFARQGGDISEPLTEMSKSFKEIWKLDQKITTSSSQARMNFTVVNGGAVFMLVMIFLGQPELIDKVFSSMIGIIVFIIGLVLYAIGFFWMRSMMRISV